MLNKNLRLVKRQSATIVRKENLEYINFNEHTGFEDWDVIYVTTYQINRCEDIIHNIFFAFNQMSDSIRFFDIFAHSLIVLNISNTRAVYDLNVGDYNDLTTAGKKVERYFSNELKLFNEDYYACCYQFSSVSIEIYSKTATAVPKNLELGIVGSYLSPEDRTETINKAVPFSLCNDNYEVVHISERIPVILRKGTPRFLSCANAYPILYFRANRSYHELYRYVSPKEEEYNINHAHIITYNFDVQDNLVVEYFNVETLFGCHGITCEFSIDGVVGYIHNKFEHTETIHETRVNILNEVPEFSRSQFGRYVKVKIITHITARNINETLMNFGLVKKTVPFTPYQIDTHAK